MVARRIRRESPQHMRWVAMVEMMAHLAERHMGQPTPVRRDVEARMDADGGRQAVDLGRVSSDLERPTWAQSRHYPAVSRRAALSHQDPRYRVSNLSVSGRRQRCTKD